MADSIGAADPAAYGFPSSGIVRDNDTNIGYTEKDAKAYNDRQKKLVDSQIKTAEETLKLKKKELEQSKGKMEADRWYQRATIELQEEAQRLKEEIDRGTLALSAELGRGRLSLDSELGLGRLGLDTDRLGLDTELGRGRLGLDTQRLGLDTELGRGRLGLDTELGRGRLGMDAATLQASLKGPRDWTQALDTASGFRNNPNMPNWLAAAGFGQAQTAYSVPSPNARPDPMTMQSLVGGLGGDSAGISSPALLSAAGLAGGQHGGGGMQSGGSSGHQNEREVYPHGGTDPVQAAALAALKASPPTTTPGMSADNIRALQVINDIYKIGGARQGAQWWESMDKDQQDYIEGAGEYLGYPIRSFLDKYTKSRFDQGQAGAL